MALLLCLSHKTITTGMRIGFRCLPTASSHSLSKTQPIVHQITPRHTMAVAAKRAITTPPPGKFEFLVIVPDKPGTTQTRIDVRQKHFEGLKPHLDSGAYKVGGAILNEVPQSDDPITFDWHGSTLIAVASSADEIKENLRRDIYTTSGVWDVDKAQIWPVKLAFRYP
ncbi:hypothetical protein F4779DRAFT_611984 [Xylariaceae sp. FL0662B]|nr:hypothetical protein F4779DRAFT_611984 [Xylariaceae sp. FL0662B]